MIGQVVDTTVALAVGVWVGWWPIIVAVLVAAAYRLAERVAPVLAEAVSGTPERVTPEPRPDWQPWTHWAHDEAMDVANMPKTSTPQMPAQRDRRTQDGAA